MKITVKLFAGFRQYLPDGAGSEGVTIDIDSAITINQVLDRFHVPITQAHLVMINGSFVSPENRDRPVFTENDILAVWPAVAGG